MHTAPLRALYLRRVSARHARQKKVVSADDFSSGILRHYLANETTTPRVRSPAQVGSACHGPMGMKLFSIGFVSLAVLAVVVPAFADPTPATAPAPAASSASAPVASAPAPSASASTYTAPDATIHGRAAKPNVLIELARPTAVSAARDAHEQMRQAWIKKLQPSTTRAVR